MTAFELLDADHLDYDAFATMQREAYADLLATMKFSDVYMSPEFYRWKFHPPAGSAKIALVLENGRMVSTNTMIPVDIRLQQHTIRGWQACDAATLISAQRKGYSSGCLRTLFDSLQNNEALFLFPNKNSVRYVNAMGAHKKGIITTWIKSTLLSKKRISPKVARITRFEKDQDKLAEQFTTCDSVLISRSADYLNWRYTNHPVVEYVLYSYREGNECQGYSVVRCAELMGRKIALIMELWGIHPSIKKCLLNSMVQWTTEQHLKWIVFQDNGQSILSGLNMGFISVPAWLLPKRQVLMVFAKPGDLSEKVIRSDWRIQIGDWDGF